MSDDDLPESIIHDDAIRIAVGVGKRCTCNERKFVVDVVNREVTCGKCGAPVDAFEAIKELAYNRDRLVRETEYLLEQRRQLVKWRPWLIVFRDLERQYRGRTMLPACPNCGKSFRFEDIRAWHGVGYEESRPGPSPPQAAPPIPPL